MRNNVSLKLSLEDKEILIQVIQIPLHAFGLDHLLEKTSASEEEIESIYKRIKDSDENKDLEFTKEEFQLLIQVYETAVEIADPQEIQTLTGYTWFQARDLIVKLKAKLESSE